MKFIKHAIWFWTESFSYMSFKRATIKEKIRIIYGCIKMCIPIAIDMTKWEKLSSKEKEIAYVTMDRIIEF